MLSNGNHESPGPAEGARSWTVDGAGTPSAAPQPEPATEPAGPPSLGQPSATPPSHGEHAADQEALAAAAAELDAVEAALSRMEDGSFDVCEVCGAPIGRDRLLQDPLLTRCPHHPGTTP